MQRWTIPLSDFTARVKTLMAQQNTAELEKLWERFVISDDYALAILGEPRKQIGGSTLFTAGGVIRDAEQARDFSHLLYLMASAVRELTDVVEEQQRRIEDLERMAVGRGARDG